MGRWVGVSESRSLPPSCFWRARLWRWPENTKVPVGHAHRSMARVPLDGAGQPARKEIPVCPVTGAQGSPVERSHRPAPWRLIKEPSIRGQRVRKVQAH